MIIIFVVSESNYDGRAIRQITNMYDVLSPARRGENGAQIIQPIKMSIKYIFVF